MKIKVSVPATSANIGSGFDALGLAVTLYNTVTFEESDHLDISAADGTRIPRGETNLVYRSAKGLFDKVGKTMPPLKLVQTNAIPMARGLGSSSACIIAGLLGANRMLGDVLNTQELLTLATSIEGHPDNVAPALLGGLASSVFEDGVVYSVKRDVDESLCFAAIVPDYKLLTEAARAALHFWEEPCISGTRGSGTVFFSGCTLKCCFCQNHPISAEGLGKEITVEHLAEIFLDLQKQGAHNINLVTPGQWRPWIIAALDIARAEGLRLPIVCNTSGYETVESVEAWRGSIDIWLADLKYVSSSLSAELSSAPDYFAQARPAIEAMMAQAGHPVFDSEGILQKGVILRHLALPGHIDDSFAVLDRMAAWNEADPGCFIPSVMSQYTPFYKAAEHGIGRRITTYEYRRVVNYAMDLGLTAGYMQQKSSAREEYTPSFDLTGI